MHHQVSVAKLDQCARASLRVSFYANKSLDPRTSKRKRHLHDKRDREIWTLYILGCSKGRVQIASFHGIAQRFSFSSSSSYILCIVPRRIDNVEILLQRQLGCRFISFSSVRWDLISPPLVANICRALLNPDDRCDWDSMFLSIAKKRNIC